jgi:hypothetical protein
MIAGEHNAGIEPRRASNFKISFRKELEGEAVEASRSNDLLGGTWTTLKFYLTI